MGKMILISLALSLSCSAAHADVTATKTAPIMLEDGTIAQMVVAKKQPFAVRHPKLHKAGRKIRRTCQVLLPVVQFAGGAAQIAQLFL